MREQAHRRSRTRGKVTAIAAAMVLGGTGVTALAVNASAGPGSTDGTEDTAQQAAAYTVACPDVGQKLDRVPRAARTDVARGLAKLDAQVAEAYEKLADGPEGGGGEADAVLGKLRQQRTGTIGRISDALAKGGSQRPDALARMDGCRMQRDDQQGTATAQQPLQDGRSPEAEPSEDEGEGGAEGQDAGQGAGQEGGQGGEPEGGQQQGGPVAADFADITEVQPNVNDPEGQEGASKGTFTSECGRNENGHFNSDNVIVAPGVSNGAHHVHDYVGNESTDAFSSDESLAAAETTCANGDLSTHYWPVLRALDGKQEDGHQPGGAHDGNVGSVLRPADVSLTLRGSPVDKVEEMPRFLRIITGDAKALTNGDANANASWSCEGFEDRQLKDKYPLCPEGSRVVRTFNFQSCWDGRNTDSGNHRDHVAFAREDGSCPDGFTAIPQLQQRIAYDVPREGVPQQTPFAVDSFPEQLHKPVTDHGDFINVMPEELMKEAVQCINSGRECG